VILTTDPTLRTSARNQLWGTVSNVHTGTVNDEITLTLASGRTVVAIVTHDSVQSLGLAEGVRVCALINSTNVILACFA
jgi:molybdate transport system regulatory protein